MDDEDGRCLLDVICDPQALNDFLHGSEKVSAPKTPKSHFFPLPQLHGQETSGNPLSAEPSQPAASVDLDFLEDDILGSPAGAGAEQPCDILQQSLQEANITEQTLEAEAELDLGSFQLPALQPVVQAADGTPQIFSGGADLLGLQPPAVLAPQALVQPPDVVNKAISVQPFLQQVGLGNVTIQPLPNLPGLPNGSPGGALGLGPIQVVGQQVMAINQPAAPQLLAKPAPVAAVGGYIAQPEAAAAQGAGLVIQKSLPAVATTTLNGSSVFGGVSAASAQPLTVTSGLGGSLVPAPNVIIHRTPTPIQPKPAGVLQQKLYQITPKPFAAGGALALPGEAPAKAQQNLTFMAGKAAPNVVLQGFPPNVFKPPPPQPPALGKSMSVHVLNQGGSIVIPAQPFQGQNQFLLPGQLAGASAVPLPQPLSALPANVGGQLLPGAGQAHIIAGQSAGAQLLANPALPAQLLNQSLAGQLNLGPVLASPGAAGTAHILSAAPIQLQPGQPAPALFQMPVSLAGTLPSPGSAAAPAPTVIQGVTLASPVAMLNAGEGLGAAAAPQNSPNSPQSGRHSQPSQPNQSNQFPLPLGGLKAATPALLPPEHPRSFALIPGPFPAPPKGGAERFQQAKPAGLKGPPQPSGGGKGPQAPPTLEAKLKKAPVLQPSKEACLLEQLHKHQGAVLHPELRSPFRSLGDALRRLLPYHVYQGVLPGEPECQRGEGMSRYPGDPPEPPVPPQRASPSAEMVMIDRIFIQEEKTALALDRQLARDRPGLGNPGMGLGTGRESREWGGNPGNGVGIPGTGLALDRQLARDRPGGNPGSGLGMGLGNLGMGLGSREWGGNPGNGAAPPPAPPKLLIKHGGGSPSVTWLGEARDSPRDPSQRGDPQRGEEEALPSRSRPPMMKTYEARSRIGLKLKIKQEAGLSKVIHNTALDPPGIPGTGTHPGPAQLNGSLEKKTPLPAHPGAAAAAAAAPCLGPLRKTYREINREISRETNRETNRETHRELPEHHREPPRSERRPVITALRRDPGSAGRGRPGKGPPEEPSDGEDEEEEDEEDEEEEEEEEEEEGCGTWGGKRRRAEAEVDKASFSSDSPQDDSLSEHLQSAIDSILNLQQPRGAPAAAPAPPAPAPAPAPAPGAAAPPFPGPPRRGPEPLVPPPSHNGGLGAARTCTR
ncbi:BRD4-interacting chromatin-remodeling complex-associated protein [Onychostruthus taczanowskii]|uniref:BRD4-interacting chromatin-remodeling complex-associated protein n=1 Tax=Onychostruthus taczanowskii TaxID=356909 RepID=UPI001B80D395|nr:BRD4-interacting chromatin-remodeling complex-associated protein [Onychostruthus taczanowskii]